MVWYIWTLVEAVKDKKHVVHCFYRCCPNPIRFVRHDTLNERSNALLAVIEHWSYCFYQFIQDAFIWSLYIGIIEPWGVNESHISCCSNFHTGCDSLVRLATCKITSIHTIRKMLWIEIWDYGKDSGLALTTFTKDTSTPLVKSLCINHFFLRNSISANFFQLIVCVC